MAIVFPDEAPDGCEYYISNGCGMPIYSGEHIQVDNDDGVEELIPWTLEACIRQALTHKVSFQSSLLLWEEVCQKYVMVTWCCFPTKIYVCCMLFVIFVSVIEQEEAEPSREGLQVIASQVDLLTVDQQECLIVSESESLLSEEELLIVGPETEDEHTLVSCKR